MEKTLANAKSGGEREPGKFGNIPPTFDSGVQSAKAQVAVVPSSNNSTITCTELQTETGTTAELKLSFYGPTANLLPRLAILSYGTGHMLNDLTAACWFTYLLIFLTDVGLSPRQAGTVMLSGQVADGIATIFVGQLIDKFGHFKYWHAGGSVLVALSFSSVFGGCLPCQLLGTNSLSAITIGYSTFAAIFNLGWAATQVSHMSLVNCITSNPTSRVSLNSCRNAFSMVANLCLYAIAYMVFRMSPGTSTEGVHTEFRWIAWISIFTGSCFVLFFLFGVKEPRLYHHSSPSKSTFCKPSMTTWFKKLLYYQVAAVYTLTRLTTNVSQALLSFYLIDDLMMGEASKAVVPALIYTCSFLTSIVLQELHWTGHLKEVYAAGACLWIFSGVVLYFLPIQLRETIYGLAGIVGLGNALMLVTATSMQGILVGHNLSGVAFVYGSLSFMDKLTCGIALYLIEGLNVHTGSCRRNHGDLGGCGESTIRTALGLVPTTCAFLAALISFSMNLKESDPEAPELSEPLLAENANGNDQSEVSAHTKNGCRSEAKGRCINNEVVSVSGEVDLDLEKDQRENNSVLTFRKRLESVMVGRWGSI